MTSNSFVAVFAAIMSLVVVVSPAYGTLIGDRADFHFQSPEDPGSEQIATDVLVTDPGVEFAFIELDESDDSSDGTKYGPQPSSEDEVYMAISVDVSDSSITLSALESSIFLPGESLTISGLDWVNDPSGIILDFTWSGGFRDDAGEIAQPTVTLLDGHSLRIDFDELFFEQGDTFTIDLITSHDTPLPPGGTAPEPLPIFLGLVGLAGLSLHASARRRRGR